MRGAQGVQGHNGVRVQRHGVHKGCRSTMVVRVQGHEGCTTVQKVQGHKGCKGIMGVRVQGHEGCTRGTTAQGVQGHKGCEGVQGQSKLGFWIPEISLQHVVLRCPHHLK